MKEFKQKGEFQVYTDGSCSNTSIYAEGGAAYIILDHEGNFVKEAAKGFVQTTNNRMELLAIISAINSLPRGSAAVVYTDSVYSINTLISETPPKANLDLWRRFHEVLNGISVRFSWVKGHSGNYYNEQVDFMAQQERERIVEKYNLPPDRFTYRKNRSLFT